MKYDDNRGRHGNPNAEQREPNQVPGQGDDAPDDRDVWEKVGYIRANPEVAGFPKLYRRRDESVGTPRGRWARVGRIGRWPIEPMKYKCPNCRSNAKKTDEVMEWRSESISDCTWHITLHCSICNLSWKSGEEDKAWKEVTVEASDDERILAGVCPSCFGRVAKVARKSDYVREFTEDAFFECWECGKAWRYGNAGDFSKPNVISEARKIRTEEKKEIKLKPVEEIWAEEKRERV